MTFHECELAILRHAVDESEAVMKAQKNKSPEIFRMVHILENFLIRKQLICYGGTAINNILPPSAQFYDRELEIPDYDFYSVDPLNDAKTLADIYYQEGYSTVEAKAGVHFGTFKVFVNFIAIADITYLHPQIFKSIKKEALIINGICYAPPNFLRMNMYLELSRPGGDVSRWEKVLKRMTLLNTYYPLQTDGNVTKCHNIELQRHMDNVQQNMDEDMIYDVVRETLVDMGVIFFGGYASAMYSKYMKKDERMFVMKIPDFDVLSDFPERVADQVIRNLRATGLSQVKFLKHPPMGEIIPEHYEILIGTETVAFIYKTVACHSYNTIHDKGKEVHVATIETILAFYLAFYYANKSYYYRDRILCMAKFLFDVEQKNRLEQRGVLKRFTFSCYGTQLTLEDIRAEKAKKYTELKTEGHKPGSKEYDRWFLKYNPVESQKIKHVTKIHMSSEQSESVKPFTKSKYPTPHLYRKIRHQSRKNKRNPRLSLESSLAKRFAFTFGP